MVEVFKTNVTKICDAEKLLSQIREHADGYFVNFDLEDCDKILRIEYKQNLDLHFLKDLFFESGFEFQILTT